MACPDLRATQGPEGKVGSLARAYARFVPNFGPQAGRKWTDSGRKRAVSTPEAPWVEFRDGLSDKTKVPTSADRSGPGTQPIRSWRSRAAFSVTMSATTTTAAAVVSGRFVRAPMRRLRVV